MKLIVSVATLIVSIALAAPSEAAAKKNSKQPVLGANISAAQFQPAVHPYDVYVSGEWVGRDPDPSIRSFMIRNPHIWDGSE
jgi:hypothetical protein